MTTGSEGKGGAETRRPDPDDNPATEVAANPSDASTTVGPCEDATEIVPAPTEAARELAWSRDEGEVWDYPTTAWWGALRQRVTDFFHPFSDEARVAALDGCDDAMDDDADDDDGEPIELPDASWAASFAAAAPIVFAASLAAFVIVVSALVYLKHTAGNTVPTVSTPAPTAALPATTPTATPTRPANTDAEFLQRLTDAGVSYSNANAAINAGKLVCADFDKGQSYAQVSALDPQDNMAGVIAAAVAVFCPDHADLMPMAAAPPATVAVAPAPPPTVTITPQVAPAPTPAAERPPAAAATPKAAAPTADTVFRRLVLQIPEMHVVDWEITEAGAHRVCGYLQAGHSHDDAVQKVLANDPTFVPWQASAMVNASAIAYCPQYGG